MVVRDKNHVRLGLAIFLLSPTLGAVVAGPTSRVGAGEIPLATDRGLAPGGVAEVFPISPCHVNVSGTITIGGTVAAAASGIISTSSS